MDYGTLGLDDLTLTALHFFHADNPCKTFVFIAPRDVTCELRQMLKIGKELYAIFSKGGGLDSASMGRIAKLAMS